MSANGLRLGLTKTQYIWLGRRQQFVKLNLTAIPLSFQLLLVITKIHTGSRASFCSLVLTSTADASTALPDVPALLTTSRSLTSTAIVTLDLAFITARLHY